MKNKITIEVDDFTHVNEAININKINVVAGKNAQWKIYN
ncbi:hypothetical protein ALNOE001_00560 [Candidatus Methanobinarius endosymbioticus]|uniref:Uncharacterized protein n=1 Tax=Candidatus Methanobinarius endosymbioticus TaxID=2006182 RepID=A0A366MGJ3_9EURY|nr:hypothetical protein ALNOE001_00560 [Candidatus Methanobinarius endosymbioticus]